MTASALGVPMVILKKQPSQILNDNLYQTVITSFTKETNYELTLSKKYISEGGSRLKNVAFLTSRMFASSMIRVFQVWSTPRVMSASRKTICRTFVCVPYWHLMNAKT